MAHPFANYQPEEYELLDRRIVSMQDDSILQWWLVVHPDSPQGVWAPFLTMIDGITVREWPLWAPLPGSQNMFLSSPVFETLLEGERGGGKSSILLMDFAKECGKGWESAWRGILFRLELGDLDEMVRKTEELFKPIFPGFRFLQSKADYAAVWPGGERLLFRHLKDLDEYKEYHGHQYPWIGFEELTQWPDLKPYNAMFSCCRPTAPGIPIRVRANTNPSGTGHNQVKKRFQLPGMRGRIIRVPGEEPRVAIHSRMDENFVLLHTDPNYKRRVLQAASSAAQAKAWGEGDWEITEGGIIDDVWKPQVHIVPNISITRLPPGWKISRSYDHGQSRPFCVLWWAESDGEAIRLPDGRYIGQVRGDLLLFAEWYGSNGQENTGIRMAPSAIAKGIKDRERDFGINFRCVGGPADTEIWSRVGSEITRAPIDDFESNGVYWDKADKSHGSRVRGLTRLRELIEGAVPHYDGTRDKPGMFVCLRCKYWLELVPSMPRDVDNPDDVPPTYEDHPVDATRYRLSWEFKGMQRRSF